MLFVKNFISENIKYAKNIINKDREPHTERFVDTSLVLGTGKKANISIALSNLDFMLTFEFFSTKGYSMIFIYFLLLLF